MKDNTLKKAPYVTKPSKKHPNFMNENKKALTRKSPQGPLMKKRLSK